MSKWCLANCKDAVLIHQLRKRFSLYASVAQLVEQETLNLKAGGSSPSGGTYGYSSKQVKTQAYQEGIRYHNA